MSEQSDPFSEIVAGLEFNEADFKACEIIPYTEIAKLQDALVDHLLVVGTVFGDTEETVEKMYHLEHLMQSDFDRIGVLNRGDVLRFSHSGFAIFGDQAGNQSAGQLSPDVCLIGTLEQAVVCFAPIDYTDNTLAPGDTYLHEQIAIAVEIRDASFHLTDEAGNVCDVILTDNDGSVYMPLIYPSMIVKRETTDMDSGSE